MAPPSIITRIREFLTRDKTLVTSAISVAVFGAGSVANVLSMLYTNRNLPKEAFGEFSALFNFFSLVTFPLLSLYHFIVRSVSGTASKQEQRKATTAYIVNFTLLAFIVTGGIALASPFLSRMFNIDSPFGFPLIALLSFIAIMFSLFGHILQGLQKVLTFTIFYNANTVFRLFFIFLFIYIGVFSHSIFYSLLAPIISGAIIMFVFMFILIGYFKGTKPTASNPFAHVTLVFWKDTVLQMLPLVIVNLLFSAAMFADILLVERFLPAQSGNYATIAQFGKTLITLPSAIIYVFYPRITANLKDWKANVKMTLRFFGFNAVVVLAAFGGILLFGKTIVHILFAGRYDIIVTYLPYYCIAAMLFSFSNICFSFFVAYRKYFAIYLYAIPVIGLYFGMRTFHASLMELVTVMLVFNGVLFLLNAGAFVIEIIRKRNETPA